MTSRGLTLVLVLLLAPWTAVHAELPAIALLPLMNYSSEPDIRFAVNWALDSSLRRDLPLADAMRVENTLRAYRIRETARLSAREIEILGAELNVDYLLCGTIQTAWKDETSQELAVAIRLVDVRSKEVRWAYSAEQRTDPAATISDLLFHAASAPPLSGIAADVASALRRALRSEHKKQPGLLAVIPLQNLSETRLAGDIATTELMTVLVNHNYRVLDPGVVSHLLAARARGFAAAAGSAAIADIRANYGANILITGEVTTYAPPNENRRDDAARVAVTLRAVSLDKSNVLASTLHSIGEAKKYNLFGTRIENRVSRACRKVLAESVAALHIQHLHD